MFNTQKQQNAIILTHPHYTDNVNTQWFDANFWQQQNKIVGTKKGRATAWFFKQDELTGVLRHYWRGGLVGKLLTDQYLYFGLTHTRVYKEFSLMIKLGQLGLNVPRPIAAQITSHGLIYRGDIITEAIKDAQSVLDVIKTRPLTSIELQAIAKTIAKFHKNGVYHADLNINNILFNDVGEVFIIDFDRGEIRQPEQQWQAANMARLERSFTKELNRHSNLHWQNQSWHSLFREYQSAL